MKKLVTILAMVVVALTVAQTATAGSQWRTVTMPTRVTGVGCSDSMLSLAQFSPWFTIDGTTNPAGYLLTVAWGDTASFTGDSLLVWLVHQPDALSDILAAQSTATTALPYGYSKVYGFAAKPTVQASFPLSKLIPLDSLAVYPIIPGKYAWAVLGGTTTAAHVMNKAYVIRCIVESAEHH